MPLTSRSSSGEKWDFAQVIFARDLSVSGLRTFGWSLSGGMDLDGNEYPDLLVGAYESAKAVYLKSSPVVHLKSEVSQSLRTIEYTLHSNARKGSNFYYKKQAFSNSIT